MTTNSILRSHSRLDSSVLGMSIFVLTEMMFFAGLISAFTIVRSGVPPMLWPPPDQPRLPVEMTALNTAALLTSGVLAIVARQRFQKIGAAAAKRYVEAALGFGAAFLLLQGFEWVRLILQGMMLTSSQLSSFFYLIVGAHGLHALAGLTVLWLAYKKLKEHKLAQGSYDAAVILWSFVVAVWPLVYWRVYL